MRRKGAPRRIGHFSSVWALDEALSADEMKLRTAAKKAAYGERVLHVPDPRHPTKVEECYLSAIEAFERRRPTAGYDWLERGDHRALLRLGRSNRSKRKRY